MSLYNNKYITNGFYEKLLLYYEIELRSATSTLEIKKIQDSFEKVYNGLIDNPIKRTPVEITINENPFAYNQAKNTVAYKPAKYSEDEVDTIRLYEEIKKMIAEGINALLNKKLITKDVSDNLNKYYQTLLDRAHNYEDI